MEVTTVNHLTVLQDDGVVTKITVLVVFLVEPV